MAQKIAPRGCYFLRHPFGSLQKIILGVLFFAPPFSGHRHLGVLFFAPPCTCGSTPPRMDLLPAFFFPLTRAIRAHEARDTERLLKTAILSNWRIQRESTKESTGQAWIGLHCSKVTSFSLNVSLLSESTLCSVCPRIKERCLAE